MRQLTYIEPGRVEWQDGPSPSTDDLGVLVRPLAFTPTTPVPLLEMYSRGVQLHASRPDSRRHLASVLDLVASGTLDPGVVPTTVVSWGDADTAWLSRPRSWSSPARPSEGIGGPTGR